MGLALDEPKENEPTVDTDGIALLIADNVKPYVVDQTIDFVDNWAGTGLIVTRAKGAGGC